MKISDGFGRVPIISILCSIFLHGDNPSRDFWKALENSLTMGMSLFEEYWSRRNVQLQNLHESRFYLVLDSVSIRQKRMKSFI